LTSLKVRNDFPPAPRWLDDVELALAFRGTGRNFRGGPAGRARRRRDACIVGEGREGAWRRRGFHFFVRFRGGPGGGRGGGGFHMFSGRARQGRGGGGYGGRTEGGGGGALAVIFVLRPCTAPQINLGCLETYRPSGGLVITLLQGHIRVMSL